MSASALGEPGPDELWVVVGPTASGKTELVLELARRFPLEVIGADSVQIYRHFDVGSGKPTAAERAAVPHHLVDCVEPTEPFDAARFVATADRTIAEVRSRGALPVVCGGTFLWVKALVNGLARVPAADETVRARHLEVVRQEGRHALHAALARVDEQAAARLSPNDVVRVSRALEIYELSGRTQSSWHADHRFAEARYRARLIGLHRPRAELDARIARRARAWLEQGWVDEVRALVARGLGSCRAMGSVGYRQVHDYLQGALSEAELEPAIVRATRVFVRRQRTWLRDEPVEWVDAPRE